MTVAHLYRPILNTTGQLQLSATVNLYNPDTTDPISVTAYSDDGLSTAVTFPYVVADGVIDLYFADPQRVSIGVTPNGGSTEIEFANVDTTPGLSVGLAGALYYAGTWDSTGTTVYPVGAVVDDGHGNYFWALVSNNDTALSTANWVFMPSGSVNGSGVTAFVLTDSTGARWAVTVDTSGHLTTTAL